MPIIYRSEKGRRLTSNEVDDNFRYLDNKEVSVTVDSIPTDSSVNPVSSNGVFDALSTKQDTLIFDLTPTSGSSNPVTSDGIYEAIQDISAPDLSFVTPEMYGAIGDGLTDDYIAIQACLDAGNTLNKAVHFKRGNTYIVGRVLTYYNKQVIVGNKATIKRRDVRATTITAIAASGATSITVTDPSIFAVGDKFIVLNAAGTYGGTGYGENSLNSANPQIVSSIVGNVINFTTSIALPVGNPIAQYPIGSPVVIINDLMTYNTGTVESVVIRDLIFDGNKASNNKSYDWRVNASISFRVPYGIIDNCEFYNTPGENIVQGGKTTVTNCRGEDLNGSFTHISLTSTDDIEQDVFINNNRILNSNIIGNAIMNHSEGAITYSANVQRLHIVNNKFYTVNGYIFGGAAASASSDEVVFQNNECYDCDDIFFLGTSGSTRIIKDTWIINNKFHRCGGMAINTTASIKTGAGPKGVKIIGNEFINTWMYIYATDVIVANNNIEIESKYNFPTPFNANRDACIFAIGFNIKIQGNTIIGKNVLDTNSRYGVMVLSDGAVKSDAATTTKWGYTQNVDISDNIITGFVNGIATEISTYAVSQTYSRVNWNIKGNQVVLCAKGAASFSYGIYASAGVVCSNNTVYGTSTTTYLYVVQGVDPSSGTIETETLGAIARFNVGIGPGAVGFFVGGSPNTNNALCEYNISTGNSDANAFFDNSGGSGNTILASNRRTNTIGVTQPTPLIILARQNPSFY